jgi:hypothetical protein
VVKVAILHEGNAQNTNDNALLRLLINHLNEDEKKVEFFGVGSKNNFFKTESSVYKDLKFGIDEGSISKVLFIVDADYIENDVKYGGFANCTRELKSIVKELKLSKMSNIYVTCNPQTQSGYLESLILSTIEENEKKCIENFLDCSSFKSKENDKAILNQIYKHAYPNAPFNFEHQNFDELKEKLKSLME